MHIRVSTLETQLQHSEGDARINHRELSDTPMLLILLKVSLMVICP
jgi:hypothetical protein